MAHGMSSHGMPAHATSSDMPNKMRQTSTSWAMECGSYWGFSTNKLRTSSVSHCTIAVLSQITYHSMHSAGMLNANSPTHMLKMLLRPVLPVNPRTFTVRRIWTPSAVWLKQVFTHLSRSSLPHIPDAKCLLSCWNVYIYGQSKF